MVISFMYMRSMTSRMVSGGQGLPAMMPVRRCDKSKESKSGWFNSAMNMVGTP